MTTQVSAVVTAQQFQLPGFRSPRSIDLHSLGVYGSPLMLLDEGWMARTPFTAHPHAGFSAVSYLFEDSEGGIRSRTSDGADLMVGPGGVVWTQAGSGLVHEEIPAKPDLEVHMVQMFVNLTSKHKLVAPRVLHLDGNDVPVWRSDNDDRVRVLVGRFDGVSSPLVPDEPFTMLDVELRHQMAYTPEGRRNTVVYVFGEALLVRVDGHTERLRKDQAMAMSGGGAAMTLEAEGTARFLILSGAQIAEPVVTSGPFIMNNRSQIEAAIARYRNGAMGRLSPR